MLICLLVGGEIPQSGIDVAEGLLVLAGIAMVIISLIVAFRQMRKATDKDFQARLDKAIGEKERQIEIDTTLKAMKESIDRLNDSVSRMRGEIGNRVDKLETKLDRHSKQIVRIDASVRSAHKRMDEHRKVDHGLPNGHHVEPDPMCEEDIDE